MCRSLLDCAEKFNKAGQRDGLGPQKIFGFLSIMRNVLQSFKWRSDWI